MISLFKNAYATIPYKSISLDDYIGFVKIGYSKEIIKRYNNIKDEALRKKEKNKIECVTIFGEFKERKNDGIVKNSGYFGVDIDKLSDEEVVDLSHNLKQDSSVYCFHKSVSGSGLFVILKTRSTSSYELYSNAEDYFLKNYGIQIDRACKDPARLRFISFDPDIYVNKSAQVFTHKADKKRISHDNKTHYITIQSDFDFSIDYIIQNNINIAPDYNDYFRIAYALANKFGEGGRHYFHSICQFSDKYNQHDADKKYSTALKDNKGSISISTVYYYFKINDIPFYSERTSNIIRTASQQKRIGADKEHTINKITEKANDLTDEEIEAIEQILSSDLPFDKSLDKNISDIDLIENFIRDNYDIKRDELTGRYYCFNEQLDTEHINSIYISCKKAFEKNISMQDIESLIFSLNTPKFNPVIDFIEKYKDIEYKGSIDAAIACIDGTIEETAYNKYFFKKWYVGMIANILGYEISPLVLILVGKQGSGKTTFIRKLLPEELKFLYAESKLDQGKDDELLMCEKGLIHDDEYSGRSKEDEKRLKELSSKDTFSLRRPYGRGNIDVKRRAALSGSCNDMDILNDLTGNRRIIPIRADNINLSGFFSIDKIAMFIEGYYLLKEAFNYLVINDDIKYLNQDKDQYRAIDAAEELIFKFFKIPDYTANFKGNFTSSDIAIVIKKLTQMNISTKKIGQILKSYGIEQQIIREGGVKKRVYELMFIKEAAKEVNPSYDISDDVPF